MAVAAAAAGWVRPWPACRPTCCDPWLGLPQSWGWASMSPTRPVCCGSTGATVRILAAWTRCVDQPLTACWEQGRGFCARRTTQRSAPSFSAASRAAAAGPASSLRQGASATADVEQLGTQPPVPQPPCHCRCRRMITWAQRWSAKEAAYKALCASGHRGSLRRPAFHELVVRPPKLFLRRRCGERPHPFKSHRSLTASSKFDPW